MAKYTGNILTNSGKDLLARAIAGGEALMFTKVELGKGIPSGDYEGLTGLVEPFKVLAITSTAKLEGGSYRVRTAFSNSGVAEDTYLREIGVFARGEDGTEILYSYCYTATPDLIPAEGSGVLERVEDVITYISNATNINAVIDQSKVYATIKDLMEGLALKEDKFIKNTAFNKNYGVGQEEVARGNHNHADKADKTSRIIAGSGMTGGGDLSGDVNLDVKRTSDPSGSSTTTCLTQAGGKAIKDSKLDRKTPNNKEAIRYYAGSSNGDGIAIGAGGLTVIGSGEYPYTKMENLGGDTPETERTYIGSDGDIIFHSGANTFANKKEAKMESNGVFRNDNGFYCAGSYMNYFKELKAGKLHFGNNDWLSYDDGTNKLSLTADGSSYTVWTDNLAPKHHSTNGYQKLPSGLILQWGSTTITGTHTVTFPIAFPAVCRAVMTTDKGSGGGIENQKIQEVSKTNFKAISTYSSGDAIYWFAVGY